ncbi:MULTISPECIES: response regulator transcription factor [Pseudoalteromonas]|uniref:Two-component system, NarL family, uhpT operon response regulator UhpA n=1 Tax=Pseudoalteromonas nigrifaciens TaxID=28109 RepID=A0AAC9XXL7_9GAMM|nr:MULTISPECIES: response regulator transcription factor [Pseudoalteromonas]ASM54152.1 two-component system, NarL family, uhpT operon response regulator UhpA [Pseudoalteromonas nigrifaciens]MBB1369587.1 response regulator transcription factor [Pseudoalteromonas sp. SR45-4]MBB1404814.1 response regulator transcription factor [Pseudoalteromonas sp. SG44-5]MBE0419902.1 response regulator transcription factor [Pseudoalteromonas nigrifaciens]MBH0092586.1 response regulator transcription factor [Pse|tara:strand:- start:3411 stop:4040 length:630 start_codon:yes stop_codon:yes gene_type:complete
MHIGIIEDHQLVRDSFKKLLELQPDWKVIIEACSVNEAKLAVELEQPDIFIVDISLNGKETGLTFLSYLFEHFPNIKTIVASMHDHEPYVSNALRLGALGYVSKRSASEELIDAVKSVALGKRYISEDVNFALTTESSALTLLTNREIEALPLFSKGLNAKQVAQALGIMPKTAHVHKANIYTKLNVTTSFELLKIAIDVGVIQLDELT